MMDAWEVVREDNRRLETEVERLRARAAQLEDAIRAWTFDHADRGTCRCSLCSALAPAKPATETRVRSVYESLPGVPDSAVEPGDYVG